MAMTIPNKKGLNLAIDDVVIDLRLCAQIARRELGPEVGHEEARMACIKALMALWLKTGIDPNKDRAAWTIACKRESQGIC